MHRSPHGNQDRKQSSCASERLSEAYTIGTDQGDKLLRLTQRSIANSVRRESQRGEDLEATDKFVTLGVVDMPGCGFYERLGLVPQCQHPK